MIVLRSEEEPVLRGFHPKLKKKTAKIAVIYEEGYGMYYASIKFHDIGNGRVISTKSYYSVGEVLIEALVTITKIYDGE